MEYVKYENLEQIDLYGTYKNYKWYLDLWHESNEPRLALFNKEDEKLYEEFIDNAKQLMTMIISGMLNNYLTEKLDKMIEKYEKGGNIDDQTDN